MKMKLLKGSVAIALTATVSSGAVTLTFAEVGNDVVMEATGSVDVTGAMLTQEDQMSSSTSIGQGNVGVIMQYLQVGDSGSPNPIEYFLGAPGTVPMLDFTPGETDAAGNIDISGVSTGPSNFGLFSNGILILGDFGQTITSAVGASHTIYDIAATSVFSGQSFASMGLDHHPQDVAIDIWKATAGAGEEGTVQFMVSSVPEPSSLSLGVLGALGLLLRRRR